MPNPPPDELLPKTIPGHVSWGKQVRYTFPWRDESYSSQEVDAYRFPHSPGTFWMNFRMSRFQENGILRTDGVRVRVIVRTAAAEVIEVLPWRVYHTAGWYSLRWPLPSLPFAEGVGIWLETDRQESSRGIVEIQGFDGAYPRSDRYVLLDEEDRHLLLFQEERDVAVYRSGSSGSGSKKKPVLATIHDLFDEDLPATHGISPTEIEGVPLFPLALSLTRV